MLSETFGKSFDNHTDRRFIETTKIGLILVYERDQSTRA